MIQFSLWLVTVEALGLAFLPLTVLLFRALPDRGYIWARILGLLLTTYLVWIAGSFIHIPTSPLLPWFVAAVLGGLLWWKLHGPVRRNWREWAGVAAIEEGLFIGALGVWSLLRVYAFGSGINHTEQFQDMAFLNASLRSGSFPPLDPWMSGHTINYYYLGYLAFATVTKMSGIAATVGYNLALSFIFAACVSGCYSIGLALSRRSLWALLAPTLVVLVGNWHALLWQVPHAVCPGSPSPNFYSWLFPATRIVGSGYTFAHWSCGGQASLLAGSSTINEFPLFSLVLGDLHPHVMALPFVLLVVGLACAVAFDEGPFTPRFSVPFLLKLLVIGVSGGALYAINSWDFPTYLLVLCGAIGINAYLTDQTRDWWRAPLLASFLVGLASVILYAPFYLHFRSLAHGLGPVTTQTSLFEFVQVFGLCFLTAGLLVASLSALLRPVSEGVEDNSVDDIPERTGVAAVGERGAGTITMLLAAVAALVVVVIFGRLVLALLLAFGVWACIVLRRVLNTEEPNRSDALALALIVVAVAVLAFTEIRYLRDAFDGSAMYRMNTIFKFYYQAWLLLSLGGAYGVYRAWRILRSNFHPAYGFAALAVSAIGIAGAGIFTWYIPSYAASDASSRSLDGMGWIQKASPGDSATIRWLKAHAHGADVELEAVGTDNDYTYHGRISTFSGVPAVLAWPGHEDQWRPWDSAGVTARSDDVRTIYMTESTSLAKTLLRRYQVRYVIVGETERADYGNRSALTKFARFMEPVFHAGDTVIYRW